MALKLLIVCSTLPDLGGGEGHACCDVPGSPGRHRASEESGDSLLAPIQHRPSLFGCWTAMLSLTLQEAIDHRVTVARQGYSLFSHIHQQSPI